MVRELGFDLHALEIEIALPVECLTNAELRVPSRSVVGLFNLSDERAGIDNFGLRVADLDVAVPEADDRTAAQLSRFFEFAKGWDTANFAEKSNR